MAAPTPTARATPGGIKLPDGYQALITFAADTDISFWEKEVTPFGREGGDPIPQSTMHNTRYHTKAPRSLIDTDDGQSTVAYDPAVLTQIDAIINVPTTITVEFGDGSTWAAYGWLRSFKPSGLSEGGQPEATVTFVISNWDPVNKVEAGPTVTSVAGT